MLFTVELRAAAVPLLHAARHPTVAVNGVLLGKIKKGTTAEDAEASESSAVHVTVVDAVALRHGDLGLAPMLEVALAQVEAYASEKELQIVGYYEASERVEDHQVSLSGTVVSASLRESFSDAIALVINGARLGDVTRNPFHAYNWGASKWSDLVIKGASKDDDKATVIFEGEKTLETIANALKRKEYEKLSDFDDHLEDLSKDWLNGAIEI